MRIFLFRGLAGRLFSKGMDQLSIKLNNAGHISTVHSWISRENVQRDTIQSYRNGELRQKIALIGHSLGGNSANFMATNLRRDGIDVAYVGTIDPTEPKANPKGIKADNFRSRDFRAEKITGAKDFYYPHLSHVQIDKDEDVHARIIKVCTTSEYGSAPTLPEQLVTNDNKLRDLSNLEIMRLLASLLKRLK